MIPCDVCGCQVAVDADYYCPTCARSICTRCVAFELPDADDDDDIGKLGVCFDCDFADKTWENVTWAST